MNEYKAGDIEIDKIIQITTAIISSRETRNEGQDDLIGLSKSGRVYISECGIEKWKLLLESPIIKH